MKKLFFAMITITLLFTSCDWIAENINPTWMGTYYPGGRSYNEHTWINKFGFKSLEECRAWAKNMIRNQTDEYECGKNCKEDTPGLFVCEMTTQ